MHEDYLLSKGASDDNFYAIQCWHLLSAVNSPGKKKKLKMNAFFSYLFHKLSFNRIMNSIQAISSLNDTSDVYIYGVKNIVLVLVPRVDSDK